MNQHPPIHRLRMSPFSPFCGWTSSLPEVFFFFTSSLPHLPPPPLLPTTYEPHPPHFIARARIVEWKVELCSCCCGAGARAAGVGAGARAARVGARARVIGVGVGARAAGVRAGVQAAGVGAGPTRPRNPRAHDQVRCLPFLCLFCLKRHRCAPTAQRSE